MDLPRWLAPSVSGAWTWEEVPPLPPLVRTEDGASAEQATRVRVAWDDAALHVRFECADRHAWGTLRQRDDPLWQEEAVEVFLAPGEADPVDYLEFEVSPRGVLFDARIHNPTSLRADLRADVAWDCPGIRWEAGSGAERQDWWAVLALPWSGFLGRPEGPPPPVWRANFYRIERPSDGPAEFSAWSPTLVRPADFHKPARFGVVELGRGLGRMR
jgi:hypothetical protein